MIKKRHGKSYMAFRIMQNYGGNKKISGIQGCLRGGGGNDDLGEHSGFFEQ